MKFFFLILLILAVNVPVWAQTEYISSSRYSEADRLDNLDGKCGLLVLSRHNDLIIRGANVNQKLLDVAFQGKRSDGYFEYAVVLDKLSPYRIKIEVSRRGSVYKTSFVQVVKPDFFVAYRLDEVGCPIRIDNQTKPGAHLNVKEGLVEFRTTIKDLRVQCAPGLNARQDTRLSEVDTSIMLTTVIVPIHVLLDARGRVNGLKDRLSRISDDDEEYDEVLDKLEGAQYTLDSLSTIFISASHTNKLSVNISDSTLANSFLGPRGKISYVVLPLIVEKEIYVTRCCGFMNEGGKLFAQRKYKDARAAYRNALSSKDLVINMRPSILEAISQCDSCILYEELIRDAMNKLSEMKKSPNVTQEELARYASAVVEFMERIYNYNPDAFYSSRISKVNTQLSNLPLKIQFTIVEWLTLKEGRHIPGVEVWLYEGTEPVLPSAFSSDKRLERYMAKHEGFRQVGISDADGKIEIELERKHLPHGILFRPGDTKNLKIKYIKVGDILKNTRGEYMKKQFRLKMFTKG